MENKYSNKRKSSSTLTSDVDESFKEFVFDNNLTTYTALSRLDVTDLATQVYSLAREVDKTQHALQTYIDTNDTRVNLLETQVNQIPELESQVNLLSDQVGDMQDQVSDNTDSIIGIDSRLVTMNQDIFDLNTSLIRTNEKVDALTVKVNAFDERLKKVESQASGVMTGGFKTAVQNTATTAPWVGDVIPESSDVVVYGRQFAGTVRGTYSKAIVFLGPMGTIDTTTKIPVSYGTSVWKYAIPDGTVHGTVTILKPNYMKI